MVVHAVEPFGQTRQVQRVDPLALILDRDRPAGPAQHRLVVDVNERQPHHAALAAVFHRVLDQVVEHLHDLVGVAGHVHRLGRHVHLEPDAGRARVGRRGRNHAADEVGKVHLLRRAATLVPLDPAQRQQIGDQTVHPPRLAFHDVQEAVARGGVVPGRSAQRLDKSHQRGQGRPQLVADIGHEIAAHLLGLLDPGAVLDRHRSAPGAADDHGPHRDDAGAVAPLGRQGGAQPQDAFGRGRQVRVVVGGGVGVGVQHPVDGVVHGWMAHDRDEGPVAQPLPEQRDGGVIGRDHARAPVHDQHRHRDRVGKLPQMPDFHAATYRSTTTRPRRYCAARIR